MHDTKGNTPAKLFFKNTAEWSNQYFRKIYDEFKNKNKEVTKSSIDSQVMINAFEYIGIAPTEDDLPGWDKLDRDIQADKLYKEFVRTYADKIKLPKPSTQGEEKVVVLTASNLISPNSAIRETELTVIKFYESIAKSNFEIAWSLFTEEFQNKTPWLGKYEKFRLGYTNTAAIRNITVSGSTQTADGVIETVISYDDEILLYTNKYLSDLDTLTIEDIDDFTTKVKNLKAYLEKHNATNVDKIELHRLFDKTVSEYIWYKCGIDAIELPNIFNSPKSQVIKRLCNVTCCQRDGKWLINRIHTNRTLPIR